SSTEQSVLRPCVKPPSTSAEQATEVAERLAGRCAGTAVHNGFDRGACRWQTCGLPRPSRGAGRWETSPVGDDCHRMERDCACENTVTGSPSCSHGQLVTLPRNAVKTGAAWALRSAATRA